MRQISSNGTFYVKYIFPIVVLIFTPFILYISFTEVFTTKEKLLTWIMNAAILILAYFAIKLKNVYLDHDVMIIKSWKKEIKIEKWEISKISDNFFGRPNILTMHLKWETEFGKVIKFIPSGGFIRLSPGKVVKNLNDWMNEK